MPRQPRRNKTRENILTRQSSLSMNKNQNILTRQSSLSINENRYDPMPYFPCYMVPTTHQCLDCKKTSSPYNSNTNTFSSPLKEYASVPSLVDLDQPAVFYNTVYKESYNKNGFSSRQNFAGSMARPRTSYHCY